MGCPRSLPSKSPGSRTRLPPGVMKVVSDPTALTSSPRSNCLRYETAVGFGAPALGCAPQKGYGRGRAASHRARPSQLSCALRCYPQRAFAYALFLPFDRQRTTTVSSANAMVGLERCKIGHPCQSSPGWEAKSLRVITPLSRQVSFNNGIEVLPTRRMAVLLTILRASAITIPTLPSNAISLVRITSRTKITSNGSTLVFAAEMKSTPRPYLLGPESRRLNTRTVNVWAMTAANQQGQNHDPASSRQFNCQRRQFP